MLTATNVQCSLYGLLHSQRIIEWEWRIEIAIGITKALLGLHAENTVHGDIKSLNVLIDPAGRAKFQLPFLKVQLEFLSGERQNLYFRTQNALRNRIFIVWELSFGNLLLIDRLLKLLTLKTFLQIILRN